jgi:acyl carrier protein
MKRISVKIENGTSPSAATWRFDSAIPRVAPRGTTAAMGLRVQRERLTMPDFDTDIRRRIIKLVDAILLQNEVAVEVLPETKLVDVGLTSVDMVSLMLGVEAEFDFTLPQDAITPESFLSVATLERMVSGQLRSAQAA